MSCSCADLPDSFDRFDAVWETDFEFRQDANHRPVPVSLFCKEYRTGAEIGPLNRNEILKLRRAPFDTARALITSYSIVAELGCFKVLDLPFPENVLCTYFETCAAINGLDIAGLMEKRPKLTEACDLFGIEHTVTRASKDTLYETVLEHENYTEEQWRVIAEGNRADVLLESMLLEFLAPTINVPAALHRGRYAKAVVDMEYRGIPISLPHLRELERQWQALRMHFIGRDDNLHLYDDKGKFCEDRLANLADARGWSLGWATNPDRKARMNIERARQAGQNTSRVETLATPARPNRRNAVGKVFQHGWRGWIQPLPNHAVLDRHRPKSAKRKGQSLFAVAAVLGAWRNCTAARVWRGPV